MSEKVWHYSVGGDRRGPVAAEELKRLAATGGIGPDDLVWKQGMAGWVAASTIKGLFAKPPALGAKPLPPPPPPPPHGVPPPSAPLSLDDSEEDERPSRSKSASFYQPVLQAWQKLPTAGKIGVASGLLLLLVSCCGGIVFVGSGFLGGDPALDAAKLARDYDADRKAADAKYKGKTLTVTGVIHIPSKGEGFAIVHLEVPRGLKSFWILTADFGARHEDDLRTLRRGETIRFRGQCDSDRFPQVHFINCELLSPSGTKASLSGGGSTKQKHAEVTHEMAASELRKGMSENDVLEALGEPRSRTGLVVVRGAAKQEWMYGGKDNVIVFFSSGWVESASSLKGIILRR